MEKDSYQLLLITNNKQIENKIRSFCDQIESAKYKVNIKDAFPTEIHCDAILLTNDQLDAWLQYNKTEPLLAPIFYLHQSDDSVTCKKIMEETTNDVLDMKKITANGFHRAVTAATEQHQVMRELNEQKIILKQLIESLTEENEDHGDTNTKDNLVDAKNLINENKKLIDKVKKQNETLKEMARVDALTGIANRRHFEETLSRLLSHAKRHQHILALLLIDLDKFKHINDTYGHHMGDAVLQEVAQRLEKKLRNGDYVARIGGDEFAVILHEIKSTHAAGIVAWKLIKSINETFNIKGKALHVGGSIGIACFPMIGETEDDLIKSADIAMYRAKKANDLKYTYATLDLQNSHIKQLDIEVEMQKALECNEFTMVYQPIYKLPLCTLHGFEALIRWKNKRLGQIPPDQFIPIAEDTGLIHRIGKWVIESVCKDVSTWIKEKNFNHKIAINLSPIQLTNDTLLTIINDTISQYNLPYHLFEFEITEMAIMHKGEQSSNIISKLNQLGASHALDDFGTGYSSISHLKHLPITTIKIDRTFVQGINVEKTDEDIVSSIIALARKMGLKVVAEGVETKEQLSSLLQENCDFVQGYYFSKPLPPTIAAQFIDASPSMLETPPDPII